MTLDPFLMPGTIIIEYFYKRFYIFGMFKIIIFIKVQMTSGATGT